MRWKLLGLIAIAAVFGSWPASASTFTYDVSFDIPTSLSISGTIVTSCDSCALSNGNDSALLNVVSWSFTGSDGLTFSSTDPGADEGQGDGPGALVANSTAINLAFGPGLSSSFGFDISVNNHDVYSLSFVYTQTANNIEWDNNGVITQSNPDELFQIATLSSVSATPLPATLPLFAGGLGFIGYLTRRKKRAQAVAAA